LPPRRNFARQHDVLTPPGDLAPKGRAEDGLDFPMEWVRRHDQY
jgi:predicted dithiol-disulfide oxidoreductase (DUF899 family)